MTENRWKMLKTKKRPKKIDRWRINLKNCFRYKALLPTSRAQQPSRRNNTPARAGPGAEAHLWWVRFEDPPSPSPTKNSGNPLVWRTIQKNYNTTLWQWQPRISLWTELFSLVLLAGLWRRQKVRLDRILCSKVVSFKRMAYLNWEVNWLATSPAPLPFSLFMCKVCLYPSFSSNFLSCVFIAV